MNPLIIRVLRPLHRWTGIATGLLFLSIAFTGVLLTFYQELNLRGHVKQTGSQLVDYSTALKRLIDKNPSARWISVSIPREHQNKLTWQIIYRESTGAPLMIADLDPSTGDVFRTRNYDSSTFGFLRKLHYTFLLGTTGKIVTCLVAFVLMILSISGIIIYKRAIRELFQWKWGKHRSFRGSLQWLHKWTGLWAIFLSLIWGLTGFCYMISIVSNAFRSSESIHQPTSLAFFDNGLPISQLHQIADSVFENAVLRSVSPRLGNNGETQIRFLFFFRNAAPWNQNGEVYLDFKTGEIARVVQPWERTNRSRYFSTLAFFHFGFNSGFLMKFIWGIGGIVMIWLPVSGYWSWTIRSKRK